MACFCAKCFEQQRAARREVEEKRRLLFESQFCRCDEESAEDSQMIVCWVCGLVKRTDPRRPGDGS